MTSTQIDITAKKKNKTKQKKKKKKKKKCTDAPFAKIVFFYNQNLNLWGNIGALLNLIIRIHTSYLPHVCEAFA